MFSFNETHCREDLFPFTLTRHTADMRTGIFTIREKWELASQLYSGLKVNQPIPANIIPGIDLFKAISESGFEQALLQTDAYKTAKYPWDLPAINAWSIIQDFELVKKLRTTAALSLTNRVTGEAGLIFLEEGAMVEHCYLNTSGGPIYIGKHAEVMEGSMLRGPISIGDHAVVKMGTSIYGATTVGPHCTVGGEIKNSILFSYSNKAHDGYLGDAVIGSWCNLGAGTSCSNVRNTATPVKAWNMGRQCFMEAGLKCGLMMGDHSRCAINTSFNTGTVVGVCANIFQSGSLQPKYIPSFSWGSDSGIRYDLAKAFRDIDNWKSFKGESLTDKEKDLLRTIYSNTEKL